MAVSYLENQPSNTQLTLFHLHGSSLHLFFEKLSCFVRCSPQNQVYPPEFTPGLANMEAAQYCPMGPGRGGCWEGCRG